jgi:hypothetical protein
MAFRTKLVAFAAAAMLLGGVPAPATSAPCGRHMSQTFRTFTVEVAFNKESYRAGETVKVDVTVTRPGQEDPANSGVPFDSPTYMPAAGVSVTTTLTINPPYYPYGAGVTDDDGKVSYKIKLPKGFKGEVNGLTQAKQTTNPNGPLCSEVNEEGYVYHYPAFTAR